MMIGGQQVKTIRTTSNKLNAVVGSVGGRQRLNMIDIPHVKYTEGRFTILLPHVFREGNDPTIEALIRKVYQLKTCHHA